MKNAVQQLIELHTISVNYMILSLNRFLLLLIYIILISSCIFFADFLLFNCIFFTDSHCIVTELHIFFHCYPPCPEFIAVTDLLLQGKETLPTFLKGELEALSSSSEPHRGRTSWPPSLKISRPDYAGHDRAPSTDTRPQVLAFTHSGD